MAGRRRPRRRPASAAIALACAGALLVGAAAAGTASAAPPPSPGALPSEQQIAASRAHESSAAAAIGALEGQIALADARTTALQDAAQGAAEAYNGAVYRFEQAKGDAADARSRAQAAEADVVTARADIGRLAADSYRSGGALGGLSLVLSSDGPAELLGRMSTMEALARNQDSSLDRLGVSQIVARVLRARAEAALEQRASALTAVTRARATAESAVAAQRDQSAALATSRQALVAQLATLRRTTVALETARERGLAEIKAAQEAQARAARARAAAAQERRRAAERAAARRAPSVATSPGASASGSSSDSARPAGVDPATWSASSSQGTASGGAAAVAYARAQLGKHYVWGAAGPETFDCSGLTMMAWGQSGVALGHWTVAQFQQSRTVSVDEARPGDLVFFATDFTDIQTIHHVGLYVGGGQMIEAPFTGADVRVSSIYRPSLFAIGRP